MVIHTDYNKQCLHLTKLNKLGVFGEMTFYISRSDEVKIIYGGKHVTYKDFMSMHPKINSTCQIN